MGNMDAKLWLLRIALLEVRQVELIKSGSHGTHTRGTSTQKYPPVGKKTWQKYLGTCESIMIQQAFL